MRGDHPEPVKKRRVVYVSTVEVVAINNDTGEIVEGKASAIGPYVTRWIALGESMKVMRNESK